jgi:hypothetical protein
MLPPFEAADFATMTALFGVAQFFLMTQKPLQRNSFWVSKRIDEKSTSKNVVFTYDFLPNIRADQRV